MYSIFDIYNRIYYIISFGDIIVNTKRVIILTKFVARKPEKEVISMRIAVDTLQEVDQKAAAVGISRNEFINQCILFALSNMDEPDNEKD